MDLETENRIAAILMKEAAELRQQAEKEGVHAYLRQPNARFRPNSRFLTATVLGVQQANRAVEVNEMWSVRQKELELDDRLKGRAGDGGRSSRRHSGSDNPQKKTSKRHAYAEPRASVSGRTGYSSSKRAIQECYSREDESSTDDDIDEFLHSRVKRGRGAVGSRMDEPGPYLPPHVDPTYNQSTDSERWGRCAVLGPQKLPSLNSSKHDEEEFLQDKLKKADKVGTSKRHSMKNKLKEKSKDKKKKKRKDKRRSKHRN